MIRLLPCLLVLFTFFSPVSVQAQIKDSFYFMKNDGEFSAEEKDEEAQYIFEQCSNNPMQNAYFQCGCIAGAFRLARDNGPLQPQSTLLFNLFRDKARECINKPGIAGEAYNFCTNHTRMFRSRDRNNEEYCECVARQAVREFAKEPKLRSKFISDVRLKALRVCDGRS